MKLRLLTLFSIIVVLAVKTYTINAQDGIIDDADIELLANWELKNKSDSLSHEKHIIRLVKDLSKSPYIAEERLNITKTNPVFKDYYRFRTAAKDYELNKLLVHPSPIIRVYAHRALMENDMEPNTTHLEIIASDSTNIEWMQGDVMVETTVMDMVTQNMFHIEQQERDTLATTENTPS